MDADFNPAFAVEEDCAGTVSFEVIAFASGKLRLVYDGGEHPVTMTLDFDEVLDGLKELDRRRLG